jgi:DNA (cytosine-5)-methyltransferase 1
MAVSNKVSNHSISLFSGGGIGDLGIQYCSKIEGIIAFCEVNKNRQKLLRNNYPNAKIFGDISEEKKNIIAYAKRKLEGKRPLMITMSPPCQGMSTNGKGRLNKGKQEKVDKKNSLILPALQIVNSLEPEIILIENVPQMATTEIPLRGKMENLLKIIKRRLKNYRLESVKMNFQYLGVPHKRSRLITIGIRKKNKASKLIGKKMLVDWRDSRVLPLPEESIISDNTPLHLESMIGDLPPIEDGVFDSNNPLHCSPKLNTWHKKIIDYTPEGKSAWYNNICADPNCSYENELKSHRCRKCRKFLLKPLVKKKYCAKCKLEFNKDSTSCETCGGSIRYRRRLVKGFKGTSYKRMSWNNIAPTITLNSGTVSSDNKIHPNQNRSLSILELLIISTIQSLRIKHPWDGKYSFEPFMTEEELLKCSSVPRDVIGESIPPLAMFEIVNTIIEKGAFEW